MNLLLKIRKNLSFIVCIYGRKKEPPETKEKKQSIFFFFIFLVAMLPRAWHPRAFLRSSSGTSPKSSAI